MKVDEKGHTIIIKDTEGEVNTFLEKVSSHHNNFKYCVKSNILISLCE